MTDEERESKQGSIDIRKLPGYEVNIRLTSFWQRMFLFSFPMITPPELVFEIKLSYFVFSMITSHSPSSTSSTSTL